MRFRGRQPTPNPWLPIGLLAIVITISLALFFWMEEPKEKQNKRGKQMVVARIKKQIRTKSSGKKKREKQTQLVKRTEKEGNLGAHKENEGHYRVRKGDSLYRIAGRKAVYGDSLKWTSLFRHNSERFSDMEVTEDFPHKMLPQGIELRFVTAEEAEKNLSKFGNDAWVVNVLSSNSSEGVVVPAIALMKKGLPVYIDRAKVKGKSWIRLRVGFFRNRQAADSASRKILSILNVKAAWVTKAQNEELRKFGGY
jgi:hypothetical protein